MLNPCETLNRKNMLSKAAKRRQRKNKLLGAKEKPLLTEIPDGKLDGKLDGKPEGKDVFFAMETGDPDDVIALLWLIAHPQITLRGIAVSKGSANQVGYLRMLLRKINDSIPLPDIPVGPVSPETKKDHLSHGIVKMFGFTDFTPSEYGERGVNLLSTFLEVYPQCTVLTGGPLTVIQECLERNPELKIYNLVTQGGFAGARCVAKEHQLEKFRDVVAIGTWNFNTDIKAAKYVLQSDRILHKRFVSKDVCHGVVWTNEIHTAVSQALQKPGVHPAWQIMYDGMDQYRSRPHRLPKKLHDPLAALCIVNPKVCEFMEVEIESTRGGWGSYPKKGTNNWISVQLHMDLFTQGFLTFE